MTPALRTRNLSIGYRHRGTARTVLGPVDLAVNPGELVVVLGVNGAGKSTLMRTLARAQAPLSGIVEIGGADIAGFRPPDLARTVGVVLTDRIAVGSMPAFRLVELGRYPHVNWAGTLNDHDRDIVEGALAAVGALHLAHRDLNELSDGERQRIMIARALAQQPAILLLDEPSAFLDVSARVEIMAMLQQLARAQQVAVILTSHDLDLALRTADTLWLFDSAGGLQIGAPEDLLASGQIAAAFSGQSVIFDPGQRAFHVVRRHIGSARLIGPPDKVALATSLLEREGFAVIDGERADLMVDLSDDTWSATLRSITQTGTTFAELGRFLRSPSAEERKS